MRAVIATEYVTLKGVMEAPGGEHSLGPRKGETAEVWASGGAMSVDRATLVYRGGEKVL